MARLVLVARRFGIEAPTFAKSEDVIECAPDCVLAWSPENAKLTPFPTYGLLTLPVARILHTPRFTRNILTYDACLTASPEVSRWVTDLAYGARKFSCPVVRFAATVQATPFAPASGAIHLAHVGTNADPAGLVPILDELVRHERVELHGPIGAWGPLAGVADGRPLPFDGESVLRVYREAGVGLNLGGPEDHGDALPTRLLEIVAASAVAITLRRPALERLFGETLLYVDGGTPEEIAGQIREHLQWIRTHRDGAFERAAAAHRIFSDRYAMDRLFPALLAMHERVLTEKGYRADPDPVYERNLPSATYIVRTGGGRPLALLRRALDSLVAQNYPKLRAILVLFREMPDVHQIVAAYPSLRIKVLRAFDGLRSRPIATGMRHVETDLFGLLDDDDFLSPNHVRMLVKAMEHHNVSPSLRSGAQEERRRGGAPLLQPDHRPTREPCAPNRPTACKVEAGANWRGPAGMAYSGSVEVWEAQAAPPAGNEADDEDALPCRERRRIEHYRLYSPAEMSQHRWFLITSWLARRSLIDQELLEDPRLDTVEDLNLALSLAERTFLAFSGEVTTNHCYQSTSATLVSSRWHDDAVRCGARHWTRLFPTEQPHAAGWQPGTPDSSQLGSVENGDLNLIGRLAPGREGARRGSVVALDDRREPLDVSTIPLALEPAFYTISAEVDGLSPGHRIGLAVCAVERDGQRGRLSSGEFAATDLERVGDFWRASVRFRVPAAIGQALVQFCLSRSPGASLTVQRLVLRKHALQSSRQVPAALARSSLTCA